MRYCQTGFWFEKNMNMPSWGCQGLYFGQVSNSFFFKFEKIFFWCKSLRNSLGGEIWFLRNSLRICTIKIFFQTWKKVVETCPNYKPWQPQHGFFVYFPNLESVWAYLSSFFFIVPFLKRIWRLESAILRVSGKLSMKGFIWKRSAKVATEVLFAIEMKISQQPGGLWMRSKVR